MKRREVLFAFLSLSLLALLSSCASSAPAIAPGSPPEVKVAILDQAAIIKRFGQAHQGNPYLEPRGVFSGKAEEFVVVAADFLAAGSEVATIEARVEDLSGTPVATSRDIRYLKELWDRNKVVDQKVNNRRLNTLDRSYVPGGLIKLRKGATSYILVLSGSFPLERPAKVVVELTVTGLGRQVFEFELPAAVK